MKYALSMQQYLVYLLGVCQHRSDRYRESIRQCSKLVSRQDMQPISANSYTPMTDEYGVKTATDIEKR